MGARKLLFITHSGRVTDANRCSLNFLTARYHSTQDRLKRLPPFEELPPEREYATYGGAISIYLVENPEKAECRVRKLGAIREKRKVQHVAVISPTDVLVGFQSAIERWQFREPLDSLDRVPARYEIIRRYRHHFLPGLHTIFPVTSELVAISASASDAVLLMNITNGNVERVLRMPEEIYGCNYELSATMDLSEHYIHNDCQTTHINCAFPFDRGRRLVVSTLIQGAIGIFDLESGSYRELIRGFVGAHGARVSEEGSVYFADSVNGNLVFVNNDGAITRRFSVESRWLHDVQQVAGSLYAFTLADRNEFAVIDIDDGRMVYRKRFRVLSENKLLSAYGRVVGWLGNSTQFLSCWDGKGASDV